MLLFSWLTRIAALTWEHSVSGFGVFFFFRKDVPTKEELQKEKRKKGRERESLHTAVPDGRHPNPGSFVEVEIQHALLHVRGVTLDLRWCVSSPGWQSSSAG